jgi:hypothetical protein
MIQGSRHWDLPSAGESEGARPAGGSRDHGVMQRDDAPLHWRCRVPEVGMPIVVALHHGECAIDVAA